jgi:gliding motility-associated-like protein
MKNFIYLVLLFSFFNLKANNNTQFTFNITKTSKGESFIENVGQFDEFATIATGKIHYAVDFGSTRIFFGENGLSFNFLEANKLKRSEREQILAKQSKDFYDHKRKERLVGKFMYRNDEVGMIWLNANNNAQLKGINEKSDYHSYYFKTESGDYENANFVKGFEKIEYKNIYPNIDLIYEIHPVSGVKYAFVVHPGADVSLIKMKYDRDITLQKGKILIPTQFGDITDHNPLTFYEGNKNKIIESKFLLNNNEVSFKLGSYNTAKTIVIDPWTQTPTFNLGWQNVWECDRDGAGNVYVIGGIMPMQLLKYDPAGVLQWTYNTPYDTSNSWLGTLTTDLVGNSYITSGSTARIQKINTNAGVVWNNPNPGGILSSAEFWNITFNCDQSRLVIGGTGGPLLGLEARIFNIDINNGNVTAQTRVAVGPMIGIPPALEEVRAICPNPNGRYYFMTHDTIGYIYDDFNFCPNNSGLSATDHGMAFGYKCENWRQDNSGIKAMKSDENFLYINRGNQLQKRNLANFSIIATAAIPGGGFNNVFLSGNSVSNSGIDIDQCGNVYVGSGTRVHKFDSNLNLLQTFNVSYNVYDVRVSTNGDIIACGGTGTNSSATRSGGVSSIAAGACSSLVIECCNAAICEPAVLCQGDAPITLVTATPGGTWSGPGINSSGLFNPALAGVGIHTIVYTLPCGSDSVQIAVSSCLALEVCVETNGQLTVSGETAPVTWEFFQPAGTQPITTQAQCVACGFSWTFGQCLNGIFPVTSCNVPAQWVTFATTTTVNAPATFPIRVTDAVGNIIEYNTLAEIQPCTQCPTITVVVNAQNNVSCNGLSNGSATVSATGGNGAITYTWQPGNLSGASQNNLAAGTYTVTARDADLCTGTTTVTITQPSAIVINASTQNTTCGNNNGSINLTTSGGSGTYTYSWNPNVSSTSSASNLAAGPYTIIVNDGACSQQTTINVASSSNPVINTISSTPETCSGDNNGTVTASASGGSGTLTYTWQQGNLSGATQNNLAPNTYTVTVTDANNCSVQQSVTVAAGPDCCNLLVTANVTSSTCGNADGSIQLTVTNGSGNYSYSWAGGSGTLSNIIAGTYSVTITDLDVPNCSVDTSFTVSDSNGPTLTITNVVNPTCGASDGSLTANLSGGTPPYVVTVDTGGTPIVVNLPFAINAPVADLPAGTVSVTVQDGNNCTVFSSVTLIEPSNCCEITVSAAIINSTCNESNGSILLTVNNGTGNYTFSWASGNNELNNIGAGTYSVTIIDVDAPVFCSIDTSFNVSDADGPSINSISAVNETCAGLNNGQVNASATGGTGILTYTWQPGNLNGASQIGLTPGIYTLIVSDQNGCEDSQQVTVVAGSGPQIIVSNIVNPTCAGNDGSLTGGISGGTAPYTVTIDTGGTPQVITLPFPINAPVNNLPAGSVTITVEDANGCSATQTITLSAPNDCCDLILVSVNGTDELCGQSNGTLEVTVTSSGTNLQYSWTNGANTPTVANVAAGTYTVTVTDPSEVNCNVTGSVTIGNVEGPAISDILTNGETCLGDADGTAVAVVTGGTPPYSYNWNGIVSNEELQSGFTGGSYILTVTDQNCSTTATFEIAPGIQTDIFVGNDTSIRSGESIQLEAETAVAATGTFSWSPSIGLSCTDCQNPVATPASDIVYTVTFADELTGCSASDNISISIIPDQPYCLFPDAFSPNNDNVNDVFREICEGITFIEVKIYNRWGELVYQESGTNSLRGWDGTYKNRKAPLDVYVFYAFIEYNNGTNESVSGNVSLIR